jgi:nitrogen regulatory protein P-II 1
MTTKHGLLVRPLSRGNGKQAMKELNIVIPHERLSDLNSILYKHEVGGMNVLKIMGRGHAERQAMETTTYEGYRTGVRSVPEFSSRTMVQVIVPDSTEKVLISDILDRLSTGSVGDGKIFVKDVSGAYDIGSKESGEKAAL